jgi:hypothetical protein
VYNAASVDDEETDIVYKIEIGALQEAGTYSSDLIYIIVAIF